MQEVIDLESSFKKLRDDRKYKIQFNMKAYWFSITNYWFVKNIDQENLPEQRLHQYEKGRDERRGNNRG